MSNPNVAENGLRPLAGSAAIVTGAGSGIGRAITVALAREGMRVLLVGRRDGPLRETARLAEIPPGLVVTADIATQEGIAAVADAAAPALRVLVHSAGYFLRGPVISLSRADWEAAAALNVHAPMLLTAACLAKLRAARGDVVFVNSSAGRQSAGAGTAIYAATKHALRAGADALRQEVNSQGIRVLSVFPGRTDTPMQAEVQKLEGRRIAPDRLLSPDDVAAVILAALRLPARAEVTEVSIRPSLPP
jgi:NADP-dependent 3-hydroxy acid dehydrogenase YdfG